MRRTLSVLALLLGISVLSALAADVTGAWKAQVPGRNGQAREVTFNLKQSGDALTGTMSGRQGDINIADGKVSGDDVSFSVTQDFGGNSMKTQYTGKVAGDEIKFKAQREGREAQEFTAKKGS